MTSYKRPALVGVLTPTTGTGDYSCGAALTGFRTFNSGALSDGDEFPYECLDRTTTPFTFERGLGRWNSGANSVTRISVTSNSSNNTAPISWGAGGSRNLFIDDGDPATTLLVLGIGTAGLLNVGTAIDNVVQLDGSAHIPTSLYVTLPHTHSSLVSSIAWTGGSNSNILKWSSAGVLAAAGLGDSVTALWPLWAKGSDGVYYEYGEVPFTGVVAGNRYYLGSAGVISTTFTNGVNDTPDGTHTMVIVGYGTATNVLYFNPSHPFAGLLSPPGSALKLEHGDFKV